MPTLPAELLTAATVKVSPVSTSLSLVSTLPVAFGLPAKTVLPGLTPEAVTAGPVFVSARATGALLVPVTAMVRVMELVAPWLSVAV